VESATGCVLSEEVPNPAGVKTGGVEGKGD